MNAQINARDGNRGGIVEKCKKLIEIALIVPDLFTVKNCYFIIALCAEYYKNYTEAIHALCKSRDAAETIKDYTICCLSYKRLANIYVTLLEYKDALRCFKLMLKYSWI